MPGCRAAHPLQVWIAPGLGLGDDFVATLSSLSEVGAASLGPQLPRRGCAPYRLAGLSDRAGRVS